MLVRRLLTGLVLNSVDLEQREGRIQRFGGLRSDPARGMLGEEALNRVQPTTSSTEE